jgi:hypothetical protein
MQVQTGQQTDITAWPLTPVGRSRWRISKRFGSGRAAFEELVPADEVLSDWSELLTISSEFGGAPISLSAIAEYFEGRVRTRSGNGELRFAIAHDDGNDLVYSWTLVGNALIEDQFEVTLLQQREGTLHAVRYAARAEPSAQPLQRAVELVLSIPERPALGIEFYDNRDIDRATGEEIQALVARFSKPLGPLDQPRPRDHYRGCLARVDRSEAPQLWASLSMLVGAQLIRSRWLPREEALRTATVALRRALEVLDDREEIWTRTVRSLGVAYLGLALLGDEAVPQPAEYALRIAEASFTTRGLAADAAIVWQSLAHLRLLGVPEPPQLREARDLLERAVATLREVGEPLEWAEAQMLLGDANAALARSLGNGPEGEQAKARARDNWRTVLDRLTADQNFSDTDQDQTVGFINDADNRLKGLDRYGIPEPLVIRMPDKERRGELLYLRPLTSAGMLRVPNRFRNPSALAVQFAVEPDPVSVEAAIYRVLGPYYDFRSIGGPTDGFGASRLYSPGGTVWKTAFALLLERAALVVIMPQTSEGVRWELEQIRLAQMLTRCLFVLPPISNDLDAPKLVAGGCALLSHLGIEAPEYDRDGLLFTVGETGNLCQVFGFDEVWNDTLEVRLVNLAR